MRRQVDELSANGVDVCYRPPPLFTAPTGLPNDIRDKFWQRSPTTGCIHVFELNSDEFRVGSAIYNRTALFGRLREMENQLRELGAT